MIKIISGCNTESLARSVTAKLKIELTEVTLTRFADGEFKVKINDSVRGSDVYIISSLSGGSESLVELLQLIDAAKRASARSIIVVSPYLGWSRQDRKEQPRTPITASLVAKLIEAAGASRLITFDLHADQIQGFYSIPVDNLRASNVLIPELKKWVDENSVICSPDVGGSKRAAYFAKELELPLIMCYKSREKDNEVSDMKVLGDVKGKHVVIVDDMIDTAGTLISAAEQLEDKGASSITAVATHALFSNNAFLKIVESPISMLFVTDTIPMEDSLGLGRLSVADYLAQVIEALDNNKSLTEIEIHN